MRRYGCVLQNLVCSKCGAISFQFKPILLEELELPHPYQDLMCVNQLGVRRSFLEQLIYDGVLSRLQQCFVELKQLNLLVRGFELGLVQWPLQL